LLGDAVTDAKYGRKTGWVFDKISAALQRKSVGFIKDIIVDTSVFDDQRVHPNWPREQLNRWYACEVCGLNYNGNCVDISAKTVKDKVVISVEPQSSFVEIINKAQPISTGRSTIGSYRQAEPNRIIVFGKCSKTAGPFSVAIERPAAFFGYLLAEHLNRTGIKVKGRLIEKRIDKEGDITLLTEFSHLMKDCLARCNKDSFGLAAEALLKTIAAKSTKSVRTPQEDNRNGSWDKGRTIISGYLRQLGIDGAEFYIDDASGLSRQNRLSARTITQVLLNVYNSQDWGLYERSLAAGGVDGTIEKYFKEPKYKGKILGKTGYIKGVKSFSGICITDKGDYIFSILSNVANGRTRDALNDIAKAIVEFGAKDK